MRKSGNRLTGPQLAAKVAHFLTAFHNLVASSRILPQPRPSDSPRSAIRQPNPGSAAAQRVVASIETARAAGNAPVHWRGSADWPAIATTGVLPGGTPRCNIVTARAVAETAARSP